MEKILTMVSERVCWLGTLAGTGAHLWALVLGLQGLEAMTVAAVAGASARPVFDWIMRELANEQS